MIQLKCQSNSYSDATGGARQVSLRIYSGDKILSKVQFVYIIAVQWTFDQVD